MKIYRYIFLLILSGLLVAGCSQEEYVPGIEEEGKPAALMLELLNTEAEEAVTKGMTEPQDREIDRVYVLIFNSSGQKVASANFTDLTSTSVTMDIVAGNGMQIYAVANYPVANGSNPGIVPTLAAVSTLNDLQNVVLSCEGIDPSTPGPLPMIGNVTKNLKALPNTNSITIDLYRTVAKVTVKFIDATAGQDVQFLTWTMMDLPKKSRLIGTASDAVDPATAADFFSVTSDRSWEQIEVLAGHSTVTQSIYMFENRRGTSAATSYKQKTQLAPAKATYLVADINCYNTSNQTTYSVETKVYLGADNYKDYNIERSKHYTYTITLNGVNDITVNVSTDSNTEAVPFPIKVEASSMLFMDGHPDQREFLISADGDLVENVAVEVLDQNGKTHSEAGFAATWLKVSPLNLLRHQVSQASPANLYQQPAPGVGYYVRPRYIPHKSFREANPSLAWSEWPSAGDPLYDDDELAFTDAKYRMCYKITNIPFSTDGTDEYVFTVYADEFDYSGHDGDSRIGKFRIWFTDKNDSMVKYLDYEVHQKQGMYVGQVVTSTLNDGADDTTPAQVAARTSYTKILVEQIEESYMSLHPDISGQNLGQMQWGYSSSQLFSYNASFCQRYEQFRNGYFLTANAVYGPGTSTWASSANYVVKGDAGAADWSSVENTYRTKFGRSGSAIGEGSAISNTGSPYYIPTASGFYDPIYNSSAARYCHEKNRDLNGDGAISPSEAKWYLPSEHELFQLWISIEAVRYSTTEYGIGYYWSSTESSGSNAYNLGFGSGFADKARGKSTAEGNGNDNVRCIRRIDLAGASNPVVKMDSNGYIIIDCSEMPADAVTTISKGSGTGQVDLSNGKLTVSTNGATVFQRFQVAKADGKAQGPSTGNATMSWGEAVGYVSANGQKYTGAYPADTRINKASGTISNKDPNAVLMYGAPAAVDYGCNAYYEGSADDPVTGKGKWRLPNKREIMMMWIYKVELEKIAGFVDFSGNSYWSATERSEKNAAIQDFGTGFCSNPVKTSSYRIRCIREVN